MFLKDEPVGNTYGEISEKIRNELFSFFKDKGISVSGIYLNMKEDNVNIRVCINKESELGMAIGGNRRVR